MAMGRSFRVFHNLAQVGQGNPYSLVLEQVRYSGYTGYKYKSSRCFNLSCVLYKC